MHVQFTTNLHHLTFFEKEKNVVATKNNDDSLCTLSFFKSDLGFLVMVVYPSKRKHGYAMVHG